MGVKLQPLSSTTDTYGNTFLSFCGQFDDGLLKCQNSLPSQYKEADDKYKSLQDRLTNDHENILFCLDSLGVVCAHEVDMHSTF